MAQQMLAVAEPRAETHHARLIPRCPSRLIVLRQVASNVLVGRPFCPFSERASLR
jgi:hypothetical protein